jgi:pimeloyl-ACP methyl ester carboxylesterase
MKSSPSFLRGDGDGPAVICLHSTGSSSRQWSRLATTQLLAEILPKSWWKAFADLGHMGPVEAPDVVNNAIERFLGAAHRRSVAFRPQDTGSVPGWGASAMA